ncbi:hypothetical protein C7974DRAFT_328184 [Boeremia exigua]|uniref:uncharacterized protein n=1 Tax=Boeremia exigua TaxID=749465 RepID=UPI001E8E0314|nr:uncharacterized protein C7974DRAFT_328184 [Boeremia exigua]KAH6642660.1 hypothetical protein C7974DRAFT_328184 [Boeremia exigua]
MKLTALLFATLSAFTAVQGYYDISSPDFRLILRSSNSTLNGTALGACHQGAATEGLCPTRETVQNPPSSYTTFYHNVSSDDNATAGAANTKGILNWILQAADGANYSSAMGLSLSDTSNVANPIFFPGMIAHSPIAFEEDGCTYIEAVQDDTVSPPVYFKPIRKVKNWYVCYTRWSYLYYTLAWKVGLTGQPQNPSCQKVDVIRVFN